MALIDVRTDLTLVRGELLRRALGVEHEAMSNEVDRCEIGLQAAAPELREVRVGRKTQDPLDDRRQDRLREQLLVLSGARAHEVLADVSTAVQLAVAARLLVEEGGELGELRRNSGLRHQKAAGSVKACARDGRSSAVAGTFRLVTSADAISDLTRAEFEALRSAAAWYAKYHAVRVAELGHDSSAYAEGRREKFLALVSALHKLGFDMALPDELRRRERQTA